MGGTEEGGTENRLRGIKKGYAESLGVRRSLHLNNTSQRKTCASTCRQPRANRARRGHLAKSTPIHVKKRRPSAHRRRITQAKDDHTRAAPKIGPRRNKTATLNPNKAEPRRQSATPVKRRMQPNQNEDVGLQSIRQGLAAGAYPKRRNNPATRRKPKESISQAHRHRWFARRQARGWQGKA